jgi:DNA-binding MarR family transcriptional regulator
MSTPIYPLSGRPMQMGLLLKLPYVALERYLDRRLRELGFADVRPAHYAVFQALMPEGSRLTELAERAGMTKQSMGYLVDHLEKQGYLQRVPDPTDQRAQTIRVTHKAKKLDEAVEAVLEEMHDAWARRLGKAKFRQLRGLLGDLVNVLHDPQPDAPVPRGTANTPNQISSRRSGTNN